MRPVLVLLFISPFYNPSYVKGEDQKRILLDDPGTVQSLLHQYETQLNKYGNALQDVQVKMAQLENKNAQLELEKKNMKDVMIRRISALEANNQTGTQSKSVCSFYVSLSHNTNLQNGAPVIFDVVYFNENYCYNKIDGTFVASVDGIYILLWKIATHSGGAAGVAVKKNGQDTGILLFVKSDNSSPNDASHFRGEVNHNSVSDFAILRLQRGDRVHLASDEDNSYIHAGHSGFGGFFLRG